MQELEPIIGERVTVIRGFNGVFAGTLSHEGDSYFLSNAEFQEYVFTRPYWEHCGNVELRDGDEIVFTRAIVDTQFYTFKNRLLSH